MNIEKIKSVFKKDLGVEVDKIIDCSKGVDHKVYVVSYKNKKYILRESIKNKNTLYNINFVLNKLKSKKVPKVLVYNKGYLIETFIPGKELDKINEKNMSNLEIQKIYFQLGKVLKEIHSIKSSFFSKWGVKLDLPYKKDFYRSINVSFYKNLKKHVDRKNFTAKELFKINNFFILNRDFLKQINSFSLINEDISKKHILIFKNKFSGLIDFGDCKFSDPLIDFRHLYEFKYDYKMKALEKGYGKRLDLNKIYFYKFIDGFGLIIWCQDNGFLKESKEIKKMILSYIK